MSLRSARFDHINRIETFKYGEDGAVRSSTKRKRIVKKGIFRENRTIQSDACDDLRGYVSRVHESIACKAVG